MELREVFQIIKRKLWLIVLIVLVVVGASGYLTINQKDSFETSTVITVQANKEKSDQYQYGGYYAIQSSDLFIDTILGWIKSSNFVAETYKNSGVDFDQNKINSLANNIYAQKVPPQNIILKVTETSKDKSNTIANNTISLIKQKTNQLSLIADSAATFEIINSDPITIPIRTNLPFNLIIAFIISIVLSLILIFFIEYLSPTINNLQRARSVFRKAPISLRGTKIKGLANQATREAEKFRFIRSNIATNKTNETESMIIAGIGEKTNASAIAANLALSYARSGKKTVLIDADFNSPDLHEFFGKPNESGFSEFLFDEDNIEKYLQKTDEANLKIMSSGIKLSYASDTIERANLEKVLKKLETGSDIVIINVPSLNTSSEAFPLFSIIKKAVIVIRIGKTNLSAANYINNFLDKKEVEKNIVIV